MERDLPGLEKKLVEANNKMLKQEIEARKWNRRFKGILGDSDENSKITEAKVKDFIKTKLLVADVDRIEFQAAHRLKGGKEGKKNIIARFLRLNDIDDVMKGLKNLEPNSGYSVSQDLPPSVDELRNELLLKRSKLEKEVKARTRLVYLKEPPFLKLVTKP
jgi:hypothetical protein